MCVYVSVCVCVLLLEQDYWSLRDSSWVTEAISCLSLNCMRPDNCVLSFDGEKVKMKGRRMERKTVGNGTGVGRDNCKRKRGVDMTTARKGKGGRMRREGLYESQQ